MANIIRVARLSEEVYYLNQVVVEEIAQPEPEGVSEITPALHEEQLNQARQMGYAEGVAAAQQQLFDEATVVHQLLQSIPNAINENRLALQAEIANIVLTIIQPLFIQQQHNPETLNQQIHTILSQLNEKQQIDLFIHPSDIERLRHGQINISLPPGSPIRIQADDQLRLGGCVIKTAHGVFDGNIERQIEALKQALLTIQQGASHA